MLPTFDNEPLTDFSNERNAALLREAIANVEAGFGREHPVVIGGKRYTTGDMLASVNPSNYDEVIGLMHKANSDLAETVWLKEVGSPDWKQPKYDETLKFGPAFDGLGNVVPAGSEADAHYCTHVRFSWLYSDTAPTLGNGLIRAEVRVFWVREGEGTVDGKAVCDPSTPAKDVGEAVENYHFVYKTSAIRQNTAS